MHSLINSALALAAWPLLVNAGQYRDLINTRNARYEKFAEPMSMYRSFEERAETYQFMSNSTKRTLKETQS